MNVKKIIKNGIFISLLTLMMPYNTYAISNVIETIEANSNTLFLKSDGSVWVTGEGTSGELGLGDGITKTNIPLKIKGLADVESVSMRRFHAFAIKKDGSVWAWGLNETGQLGLGDEIDRNIPTKVESLTNVKKIVTGFAHTIALKNDGTVWSWGQNTYGELGLGNNEDINIPTKIESLSNVKDIIGGYNHTFAIKEDGSVWAWGFNETGQLGLGDEIDRNIPTKVESLKNVKQIISGGYHAFAIKEDNSVWTWGENAFGELGLGDELERSTPTQVTTLSDVKQIAAGWGATIALKNDGTVWAWGDNCSGESGLGDNGYDFCRNVPTKVEGINNVVKVSANWCRSSIIKEDGTLWVTGGNYRGELGLGDEEDRNIFTRVATPEELATENAEVTKTVENIETARDLVNKLPESEEKEELQDRLNKIDPNLEFEVKNATANLDIYIKSKNMLSLSLSTNNITFEDFSGIQDEEKLNALTLTVNSSLPYDVRAYLPEEIRGSRFNETMDKRIFNIRANGEEEYQTFTDTTNPIILLDNQVEGNKKVHGIDLKLKGNLAHKKDIYKATVKFEVVQK